MIGMTVESTCAFVCNGIYLPPKLGCDHHGVAHRSKRFANDLFICERSVCFRCIEECHAAIERGAYNGNCIAFIRCCAVTKAQAHCSVANCGDLETVGSQFSCLHCHSVKVYRTTALKRNPVATSLAVESMHRLHGQQNCEIDPKLSIAAHCTQAELACAPKHLAEDNIERELVFSGPLRNHAPNLRPVTTKKCRRERLIAMCR